MPDIVLATLNAKFIHAAFGLRYLFENLGPLQERTRLLEFEIKQRPVDVAERILAERPRIVGLGVYIWNAVPMAELVSILKRVEPSLIVILGGPEVSHETEQQGIVQLADYVITGEADLKFAEVCRELLEGNRPTQKVLAAPLPDFDQLRLPYEHYSGSDIANRIIYLEASRGCPFSCEFCLSSLEVPVRQAPLPALLAEMEKLLRRGVRHFKFVDRTFNLNLAVSRSILEFCLAHYEPGLFFHFEMIPDRLPEGLREVISRFPAGSLQFEVGIQTFNEEVANLISRRQNYDRLEENFRFLRTRTGVHLHADLIAGLPGETMESFGHGFDRLVAMDPQEIQVGILKRLRGTPISRHTATWAMVYSELPPYEILQNRLIPFAEMQKLKRFSRFWDLLANSGNFVETKRLIWAGEPSAFAAFMQLSEWLFATTNRTDAIALPRLMELLFQYLTRHKAHEPELVGGAIWRDYSRAGRSDKPPFLRPFIQGNIQAPSVTSGVPLKRQARHHSASAT